MSYRQGLSINKLMKSFFLCFV